MLQFFRPWRDSVPLGSFHPPLETVGYFRTSLAGLERWRASKDARPSVHRPERTVVAQRRWQATRSQAGSQPTFFNRTPRLRLALAPAVLDLGLKVCQREVRDGSRLHFRKRNWQPKLLRMRKSASLNRPSNAQTSSRKLRLLRTAVPGINISV